MKVSIKHVKGIDRIHRVIMKLPLTLFFIICSNPLLAQVISLDTILNKIEKQNPALLSYSEKLKSDQAMAGGAGAWMPTTFSAEWDNIPYQFDAGKTMLKLTVMQDFPNPGVVKAKRNYYNSITATTLNESDFLKFQLFARAKEAYYGRYVSEQKIRVFEENNKLISFMIELSQKQMGAGKNELSGIYRLKTKLAENETRITEEKNKIRTEIITLNYLMNEDINQSFDIDSVHILSYNARVKFSGDSIEFKRSDILGINSSIQTMALNRNLISMSARPVFGVRVGNYTKFGGMPDAYAIMGNLSIPLFAKSTIGYKSEIKSMEFQIKAMERNKEHLIKEARQIIEIYFSQMESVSLQMNQYRDNIIPGFQKSVDAGLLAYSGNSGDLLNALMALDDLQAARIEYMKLLDQYFMTKILYENEFQIR